MRLIVAVSGGPPAGQPEWAVELRDGARPFVTNRMLAVVGPSRTLPWPAADPRPSDGDPALAPWKAQVAAVDTGPTLAEVAAARASGQCPGPRAVLVVPSLPVEVAGEAARLVQAHLVGKVGKARPPGPDRILFAAGRLKAAIVDHGRRTDDVEAARRAALRVLLVLSPWRS